MVRASFVFRLRKSILLEDAGLGDDAGDGAADQRGDDEQPELADRGTPENSAGPIERAGLSDLPVTGMMAKCRPASVRPMTRPANASYAWRW